MYSYCYVCSVLGILFHCVVLCTVCVETCNVLLPPGVNPIAVNKYEYIKYFGAGTELIYICYPSVSLNPMPSSSEKGSF